MKLTKKLLAASMAGIMGVAAVGGTATAIISSVVANADETQVATNRFENAKVTGIKEVEAEQQTSSHVDVTLTKGENTYTVRIKVIDNQANEEEEAEVVALSEEETQRFTVEYYTVENSQETEITEKEEIATLDKLLTISKITSIEASKKGNITDKKAYVQYNELASDSDSDADTDTDTDSSGSEGGSGTGAPDAGGSGQDSSGPSAPGTGAETGGPGSGGDQDDESQGGGPGSGGDQDDDKQDQVATVSALDNAATSDTLTEQEESKTMIAYVTVKEYVAKAPEAQQGAGASTINASGENGDFNAILSANKVNLAGVKNIFSIKDFAEKNIDATIARIQTENNLNSPEEAEALISALLGQNWKESVKSFLLTMTLVLYA